MIKRLLKISMMSVLIVSLIACGNTQTTGTDNGSEEVGATSPEVTLKFGHYFTTEDSVGRSAQHWADLVEEKSGGSITVEVYPSEQLVKGKDGFQATAQGTVDIYTIVPSYISGQVPIFDFFGLPLPDPNYTYDVMYDVANEAKPIIQEYLEPNNIYNLGVIHTTGRSELYFSKPVESIDDIDGLKLRGIGGMLDEVMQNVGASTSFLSAAELYLALQTGTIDGVTTSYTSYVADNLHEVAPYWLRINLVQFPMFLFMNNEKWNSLTPEQQTVLTEATEETLDWLKGHQMEEEEEILAEMEENAKGVYTVDDEEWERWYEIVEPLHDRFISENGEDAEKLIEIRDRHLNK